MKTKLFCFHHAGGNAGFYRRWKRALHADWEAVPVQLKGRAARVDEKMEETFSELVASLCKEIDTREPFAFFGHSFGALVAYEVARELKQKRREPKHLFVSACDAPHRFRKSEHRISDLPREQLIGEMLSRGGSPTAILQNESLMEMMLPVLRADFKLMDDYALATGEKLSCPITVLEGKDDATVTRESLLDWWKHTTGAFTCKTFDGGHFYLMEEETKVLHFVDESLSDSGSDEMCVGTA